MVRYLDLSEAEIAGLLGFGAGSVKQHASRAINRLAAPSGGDTVNGERPDQVVARQRAAFQEDADLAMAQADVRGASGLAVFQYRANVWCSWPIAGPRMRMLSAVKLSP